jgi:cytochrome c-type biogenesis protein CcmE
MSKKTARALVSGIVILSALVLLLVVTVSEGASYYKHVDEVMVAPEQWYGKNMSLHGFVVDRSIEYVPGTLNYRFKIKTGDHVVQAAYTGVVPDTFKDGSEVVLKGRLSPGGFEVERNGVTAKCPSKYEAAGPAVGAKKSQY